MHDQIERTGKNEQHDVNDRPSRPEVIDLRAPRPDVPRPDVIDLRERPGSPELRQPPPAWPLEAPERTRLAEPPAQQAGRGESSVGVWVVTLLAILASLVVIIVVAQHPQPASAARPVPPTLGEQLDLG